MPPEGFMEDGMKERFENGERPEFGKGRGEGFEFGGERGFGERREFSEGEERGQRMGKGNGQGMKNAGGKGPMGKISPKNLAKTAGQTFSIIIFYAMISFLLGELAAKIKAKKIKDE